MYRGKIKISPGIPGREPWKRCRYTSGTGVGNLPRSPSTSSYSREGGGEGDRQLVSVIQGVVRQMMMIAMDGEGDLTALRQLLNMIPDSSSEESNQQMLSMIQGVARQ